MPWTETLPMQRLNSSVSALAARIFSVLYRAFNKTALTVLLSVRNCNQYYFKDILI